MTFTLEKLETLLAGECEKIDELHVFSSVSPDVYSLLYIVARQGPIEAADAVFVAKNCSRLMSFLISNLLTSDDVGQVYTVIDHINAQPEKSLLDCQAMLVLMAFTARHRQEAVRREP